MLYSIIQGFAAFGAFLFSIVVVAGGVVGCLIATGVFTQQFGPLVLRANEDKSITFGMKSGAVLGLVWSVVAIYQLGNISAIFSLIGLCVAILFCALLTWFIGDLRTPVRSSEFD
jgi:hypothetical protein